MIDESEKKRMLEGAKKWFRENIAPSHIKNTEKLRDPSKLKVNPFLVKYLACFLTGKCDEVSIAKALIYPRVLGTSISTSLGSHMQGFISKALGSFGSATAGIDIEFIDQIDGRKKYCQVKLGPNTINKDDVVSIHEHFSIAKGTAIRNSLKIQYGDLIIGVLYGEEHQLSAHYKKLKSKYEYPVYVGKEFWKRLTGLENFYNELSNAIGEIAIEHDSSQLLEETIDKLSQSNFVRALCDK